ncbi:MAG: hypothetical protein ABI901_10920 [Roseiflexaceae bacterium]
MPAERLAFVPHDIFAVPFEQIAPITVRREKIVAIDSLVDRRRLRQLDLAVLDD